VQWSAALEALFRLLHERGGWLYNTAGISRWKRKWRAATTASFVAVDARLPWRHVAALLFLAVAGGAPALPTRARHRYPPREGSSAARKR